MRLNNVGHGTHFRFKGSQQVWLSRGGGFYGRPAGYDGGPWHEQGNPEIEVVVIGVGDRVTYHPNFTPCEYSDRPMFRVGTVVDVLVHATKPPVYRVRWDDDRERVVSMDDTSAVLADGCVGAIGKPLREMVTRSLKDAVARNRKFHRARRVLSGVRLRMFDYEDAGKGEKAERIVRRCIEVVREFQGK